MYLSDNILDLSHFMTGALQIRAYLPESWRWQKLPKHVANLIEHSNVSEHTKPVLERGKFPNIISQMSTT